MPKSRITIVGLGLVGGSIGLALKKSKVDVEIIGHDKNSGAADRAKKMGAVDTTKWNLIDACNGAGMIVLALPLDGVKDTLDALKPHLEPGVIVTDTATTKASVLEWAKDLKPGVQFIGGDPVLKPSRAKTERGIDAAEADLFQGGVYCLTPSSASAPGTLDTLSNFAELLGAKPYFIDAAEHDGLMASVQHMPALLATALASSIVTSSGWRELGKVAGAEFGAAMNLVPPDGKVAREQFLAHRDDLVRWIDTLTVKLRDLRGTLERADGAALETLVDEIATERNRWLSGTLEGTASSVDMSQVQFNAMRLFIGGLADRSRKK